MVQSIIPSSPYHLLNRDGVLQWSSWAAYLPIRSTFAMSVVVWHLYATPKTSNRDMFANTNGKDQRFMWYYCLGAGTCLLTIWKIIRRNLRYSKKSELWTMVLHQACFAQFTLRWYLQEWRNYVHGQKLWCFGKYIPMLLHSRWIGRASRGLYTY